MKKEALLSALVLGAPLSALTTHEIWEVRAMASETQNALVSSEFRSNRTYRSKMWKKGANGKWISRDADVYFRLKFIATGEINASYTYDGVGVLDYEVVIEKEDALTGEIGPSESTVFAVVENGSQIRFFDCDTTRFCWKDRNNTGGTLLPLEENLVLDIDNGRGSLIPLPEETIRFSKLN